MNRMDKMDRMNRTDRMDRMDRKEGRKEACNKRVLGLNFKGSSMYHMGREGWWD